MATNLDQQITQNVPEFFFIWDLAQQKIIHLTESLQNYARTSLDVKPAYQWMLEFIHPDHQKQGKEAVLIVSDTGVGIALGQQEEIFKEFSRARRKGLRGEKSTGLGLSIVKKVVEMHQGTIKVESQPGRGTAFTIRLQQE